MVTKKDSQILDQMDIAVDGFPPWSRTLLLLLDYAIIEGAYHDLHNFVSFLELAQKELNARLLVTDRSGSKECH